MRMDLSIVSDYAGVRWMCERRGQTNGDSHDRVDGEDQFWLDLIKSKAELRIR